MRSISHKTEKNIIDNRHKGHIRTLNITAGVWKGLLNEVDVSKLPLRYNVVP